MGLSALKQIFTACVVRSFWNPSHWGKPTTGSEFKLPGAWILSPDFTSLPLLQLRPYLLNFVSWFLEFHRCQHALQAAFAILESRTWLSKRSSAKKTTPGCFDSDFADTCKWCPPNNKFDKQRQKDCRFSSYALWPPSAYLNLTQVRRCCLSYDSAN